MVCFLCTCSVLVCCLCVFLFSNVFACFCDLLFDAVIVVLFVFVCFVCAFLCLMCLCALFVSYCVLLYGLLFFV